MRKSFILFDNGAQSSYITENLKEKLHLNVIPSESVAIKVFGQSKATIKDISVVRVKVLGLREAIFMEARNL